MLCAARASASGNQRGRMQVGKLLLAGRIAIICLNFKVSPCTHLKPYLSTDKICREHTSAMIKLNFYFFFPSDPNSGDSKVPVTWPAYTTEGGYYLEINNKINSDSVKQNLRTQYVNYWNSVYLNLPKAS